MIEIHHEEQARQALAAWRELPAVTRTRNIRAAISKLELNQMYYEQKGSEPGMLRTQQCLTLLKCCLAEMENNPKR